MSDLIKPSGGGSSSDETRKVVGGWHAMQEGKRESRQQRMMREQQERSERVKQGLPAEKETGFRPGQDEASDEFSLRRMKEHAQKIVKKNATKFSFVGNSDKIALKLVTLYEEKGDKVHVCGVEEAGFGVYKLTYFID